MDNGESQLTGDCSLLEDSNGGVPPLVVPVIKLESSDENGSSSEAEVLSKTPRSSHPQEHPEELMEKKISRSKGSLQLLTRRFLRLMHEAPGYCVDLSYVSARLQTHRRRLYDITNALYGAQVIEKESKNKVRWIGKCPISVMLSNKKKELEKLRQVEATLDGLIKNCARQLFDITDDDKNSPWAYVTHQDLELLQTFQEQTVVAVRAPEETKMEIPVPTEDSIQVHLKASQGPITILTCELGPSRPMETTACFLGLEESRIRTKTHTPDSQSAVQDS